MKKITKLLALLLALTLVFSLTACSRQDSVAGTWKYTMNLVEMMEAAGALDTEDDDSGLYRADQLQALKNIYIRMFDGLTMVIVLDLRRNHTYTTEMDEDASTAAAETLSARMPELVPEILAVLYDKPAEELPDFLAAYGLTLDELIESERMSVEKLLSGMAFEPVHGTYTYEEGKLVLTAEDSSEPTVLTVELSPKELKVTAIESKDSNEADLALFVSLLPLIFAK